MQLSEYQDLLKLIKAWNAEKKITNIRIEKLWTLHKIFYSGKINGWMHIIKTTKNKIFSEQLTSKPSNELLFGQFSKIICITRNICITAYFGNGLSSSRILSDNVKSFLHDKYTLKNVSKWRNNGLQWWKLPWKIKSMAYKWWEKK